MIAVVDIPRGTTFGRLTVLSTRHGKKRTNTGRICTCRCSCGSKVVRRAVDVRRGLAISCKGKHPCSVCGAPISRIGEAGHLRGCRAKATAARISAAARSAA